MASVQRSLMRAALSAAAATRSVGACAPARHMATNSIGPRVRSATTGLRATIFGAYGFIGRYVTALIAGSGTQVVIPYRGDDMEWRPLRVMGDLGMVAPVPFHPRDLDSVRRCVEGSDIVINLMGKDYETKHIFPWMKNSTFEETNITHAQTVAKAAVEAGSTCLIHMSALGADPHSISRWARTKAAGEEAVRAIAPGATIVRPADVFGAEDRFLNLFANMHSFPLFPQMPLVNGGTARTQPLFVQDLATAIYKIAMSEEPEFMLGQTYDFAGPEQYTYKEVVEYVFETIRAEEPSIANISPAVGNAIGTALELFPNPLIGKDRFARMQSDVVLNDLAPTKRLHDLGIEATSMESPGFTFLHRYRTGSHFLDMAASGPGSGKR